MSYLDLENKSIIYNNDPDRKLVEIKSTEQEIENMTLEQVRELVKKEIAEATLFQFNYQ